ncbi:MAG: TlpA disulfide reductase family protein [Bacteroidota bacterium]|nr:TlpA disulfide reductase family protein [Bacteroidota bacterium]
MKIIICSFLFLFFITTEVYNQTIIKGKLLSYDGSPMPKAHVHYFDNKKTNSIEVGNDGFFEFTTDLNGIVKFSCSGVNHNLTDVALLAENTGTYVVEVNLSPYEYADAVNGVKIIGDFNAFDFETAQQMIKEPDGTYTSVFNTSEEKFSYQILGIVANRSVNGTMSEDYEYDGGGDYRSIVTPEDGKVKIIFDPAKLIRSKNKPEIIVKHDDIAVQKFSAYFSDYSQLYKEKEKAYSLSLNSHIASGKKLRDFKFNWVQEQVDKLKNKISVEQNQKLRQFLLLSYFQLYSFDPKNADSTLINRVIQEVPLNSIFWGADAQLNATALSSLNKKGNINFYISNLLEENTNDKLKSALLYAEYERLKSDGLDGDAEKYYNKLINGYSNSREVKALKIKNLKLVGSLVPEFSFVSLDEPNVVYTNESLKGKNYLLDFWATWCKPCVDEMENLHKTYEKFKDKNFEIISISLDNSPKAVNKFREGKWKMPWLHSFLNNGFQNKIAEKFGIVGIPKPVLVDVSGKVVAADFELRGENLETKISEILK